MKPNNDIITSGLQVLDAAFRSDDRNRAHAVIDETFEQLARAESSEAITKMTPIRSILKERWANQLEACGIYNIQQLCERTRTDLAEGPRLQLRSISIIEDELARHGFKLRRMTAGESV